MPTFMQAHYNVVWKTIIPVNDYGSQTINILFQSEQFFFLYALVRIRRININIVKTKKFL